MLVVALLVLAVLSILGAVSIHTSITDLNISRNEREIEEVFYLSESAAMEGVQRLIDTPTVDLSEKTQPWHHSKLSIKRDKLDFRDPRLWDADGPDRKNAMRSMLDPGSFFAAVETRLASGSSAIVTESRLYMNRVYGLSVKYDAFNIVEIGYYQRY